MKVSYTEAGSNRRFVLLVSVTAVVLAALIVTTVVPYIERGLWPLSPADWVSIVLPLVAVATAALLINVVVARSQRQAGHLVAAYQDLRDSQASGRVDEERLRAAVAAGAEALRISVAEGVDGVEALRVSVASGLDAASAALAVVDSVDAGITFYDTEGTVLLTNETARALTLSKAAVFEQDRVTPVADADLPLALALSGRLVTRRSYWIGSGDDQRAIVATSQFVRRASGELIGIVVATHDVTPLAEAIESRDEFLTTVSHELLTPLTSVIGYLEVIEDTVDIESAGFAPEFAVVQRNVARLNDLIRDLLTNAENETSLERRMTDISTLAANALDTIRPRAAAAGISLVELDDHVVLAEVDADRIAHVLDTLLSNAVAFNRPGGSVSLSVADEGADAVVRVIDTGKGMVDAEITRIFDRFFRSPASRSERIAGAGLGLSTARIIAEAHRGSIEVYSSPGTGTTMELRFPLRVAA